MTDAAAQPVTEQRRAPGLGLALFLMVLYSFSFIDRAIIGLLVQPIKADLHLTDTQFSLLAGPAFIVFYVVAGIPLGYVADRWNRRNLIAIGVAFWSLATAAGGLATNAWQLFLSRFGVGVGEATLSPCTWSILSSVLPPRKLVIALSIFALGTPIGSGLAALVGGPLVHALTDSMAGQDTMFRPWQVALMVVGLPGLIFALLTLFVVKEPPRAPVPKKVSAQDPDGTVLRYLGRNWRVYAALIVGMGMMNLAASGAAAWYPAFLQRRHGLDIGNIGILIGTSTLVFGIIGALCSGWLARHWFTRRLFDAHYRVGALYALLLLPCAVLGPIVPDRTLAMILIAVSALFSMTWVGVSAAALQLVTPDRMRGRISAVYQSIGSLIGAGIGPTVVALVTDYGFGDEQMVGWSLAVVAGVALTISWLALTCGRKHLARLAEERIEHQPKDD